MPLPETSDEIRREMSRIRDDLEQSIRDRQEDRIRKVEEYAEIRMSVSNLEGRLKILEDGVSRLMMHSTWLLRLLVGGFIIALVNFTVEGGLLNGAQ